MSLLHQRPRRRKQHPGDHQQRAQMLENTPASSRELRRVEELDNADINTPSYGVADSGSLAGLEDPSNPIID